MAETGMKNIQLKPDENARLVALLGRSGLSSTEAVRRMIAWLGDAPDVVRAEILGVLPEGIRPQAKDWIIKNMPEMPSFGVNRNIDWSNAQLNESPNASISKAHAVTTNAPATATANSRSADGRSVKGRK